MIITHHRGGCEEAQGIVSREEYEADRLRGTDQNLGEGRGFPGDLVVKILTSSAGVMGSIPGKEAKIPHASKPTNQNIKQKQYCTKLNKDIKMVYVKKKKKESQQGDIGPLPGDLKEASGFLGLGFLIYSAGLALMIYNVPPGSDISHCWVE